jgi:hypothetical protein
MAFSARSIRSYLHDGEKQLELFLAAVWAGYGGRENARQTSGLPRTPDPLYSGPTRIATSTRHAT